MTGPAPRDSRPLATVAGLAAVAVLCLAFLPWRRTPPLPVEQAVGIGRDQSSNGLEFVGFLLLLGLLALAVLALAELRGAVAASPERVPFTAVGLGLALALWSLFRWASPAGTGTDARFGAPLTFLVAVALVAAAVRLRAAGSPGPRPRRSTTRRDA